MKVFINSQEVNVEAKFLSQVIEELALPAYGIAIAVNNRLVPRTEWEEYALNEGMQLVIIKAVCGG